MNLDFLKEIGQQLAAIWKEIKTYQKFTVVSVALLLVALLGVMVYNASSARYQPLFPSDRLTISDAAEIKGYLDGARVSYKLQGDTSILVNANEASRIRMDLAAVGLPKMHNSKGFELFDSNTSIKGEKDLQILEMRALMGQLERDISEYENIRGANVILDLAPPRPFGGSEYKAKASVILTLMPGGRLSNSQLRSITYHVAGAVRGLTPNMVAISDTSGRLYQSIDPNGEVDNLRAAEVGLEERLKTKVDGMLAMVVGHGNFYSTVNVTMSRKRLFQERKIYSGEVDGNALGDPVIMAVTEQGLQLSEKERAEQGSPGTNNEAVAGAVLGANTDLVNRSEQRNSQHRQMAVPVDHVKMNLLPGQIESISIGVLIDKTITVNANADLPEGEVVDGRRNSELLRAEIEHQLAKISEGYNVKAVPAVDFVEFDKTKLNQTQQEESWVSLMETMTKIITALFVAMTVGGMLWTFNKFWRRHMLQPPQLETDEIDEELDHLEEPSLVEVEAMVESIKTRFQNDPTTVADSVHEWLAEEETAGTQSEFAGHR